MPKPNVKTISSSIDTYVGEAEGPDVGASVGADLVGALITSQVLSPPRLERT